MASISFPKAQNGGFAGLPNLSYTSVQLLVNNRIFDTTGSNAGLADTFKKFCLGFATIDVAFQATIRVSGACSKSQNGSMDPGDFEIKPQQIQLSRSWPLDDVTGSGDTEKNWEWGISTLATNVRGKVIATGPIYDDQEMTIVQDIDQVGSFSIPVVIRSTATGMPFNRGGPFPFNFSALGNGAWTLTPDSTNFTSTMSQSVLDPWKDDIAIDLDTGEAITHAAILYQLSFSQNMESGGPVFVNGRFRFDAASA
jgi:hypothetical protein